jgi:NADH-quinone oxidoreductase subunit A
MALDLGIILLFFIIGGGFVFMNLLLGKYFRPDNPYDDKNEIYECGERPIGGAWIQFNPRFYLVALIFLIFDVEIAFVFPIATVFKRYIAEGRGGLAFAELFIFMFVLLLGLIYVWLKGDLQWVKQIRPAAHAPAPAPVRLGHGH